MFKLIVASIIVMVLAFACNTAEPRVTAPGGYQTPTGKAVAIGDSVTRLGSPDGWVSEYLGDQNTYNLGVDGTTSYELGNVLSSKYLVDAERVVLLIGFNDYFRTRGQYLAGDCDEGCFDFAASTFASSLDDILAAIHTEAPCASVVVGDLYDLSYLDGGDPVLASFEGRLNSYIHATGEPVAPVAEAFGTSEGLILGDGVHPNDRGQKRIAEAFSGTRPHLPC